MTQNASYYIKWVANSEIFIKIVVEHPLYSCRPIDGNHVRKQVY